MTGLEDGSEVGRQRCGEYGEREMEMREGARKGDRFCLSWRSEAEFGWLSKGGEPEPLTSSVAFLSPGPLPSLPSVTRSFAHVGQLPDKGKLVPPKATKERNCCAERTLTLLAPVPLLNMNLTLGNDSQLAFVPSTSGDTLLPVSLKSGLMAGNKLEHVGVNLGQ